MRTRTCTQNGTESVSLVKNWLNYVMTIRSFYQMLAGEAVVKISMRHCNEYIYSLQ